MDVLAFCAESFAVSAAIGYCRVPLPWPAHKRTWTGLRVLSSQLALSFFDAPSLLRLCDFLLTVSRDDMDRSNLHSMTRGRSSVARPPPVQAMPQDPSPANHSHAERWALERHRRDRWVEKHVSRRLVRVRSGAPTCTWRTAQGFQVFPPSKQRLATALSTSWKKSQSAATARLLSFGPGRLGVLYHDLG